ncbi:MAG: molecular chaperone [Lachnospiraceae bacterium]
MDKYTYTLNQENIVRKENHYYSRAELELMTTYQLRDICWRERIINGIQAPLDKDVLIRQILRFRGRKDNLFITKYSEEGLRRLEGILKGADIRRLPQPVKGCARIFTYTGLGVTAADGFTIGYQPEIVDTNALLVSGNQICAIFQIRQLKGERDRLYLTKAAEIECRESPVKSYGLYCMERLQSDTLYRLYEGEADILPAHLHIYEIPIMDFQVRNPRQIDMPLAIDFGTSNTTAGIYLDSSYIESLEGDPIKDRLKENEANYVWFQQDEHGEETPILPSMVGVLGIQGEQIQYVFGHQANRLFHTSYIDEGFCVFCDIKRWISDPNREEELVDRNGYRCFVKRKEIIKAFLEYVIFCATQRFKCHFQRLHLSAPVKQKRLFLHLYKEILPKYEILEEDMLDEGVAVLYNSIAELIARKSFPNNRELKALIIDCGGGTTDLSSCRFTINEHRVSYAIRIATAYENGDTDFGGNNLTCRIMEMLKLALVHQLESRGYMAEEIIEGMGKDIFRRVDDEGVEAVYGRLDAEYQKAEAVIPTRFKDYEHRSNVDYFAVKNNFYFLFELAEKIKKTFYEKGDALRVVISSVPITETATVCILADRFKLSVYEGEQLNVLKDIPTVYFSINQLNRLLQGDIYRIVKRFIERPYENDRLQEYSIMRLTGQSCKIDIFRDALKEFIPGKIIESSRRNHPEAEKYELKLMCLEGAIKYIRDKRFGYADVTIINEQPAFPYLITAITHTGKEQVLIKSLDRTQTWGYTSRNLTDLTLQLYLKDLNGQQRYKYNCSFNRSEFEAIEAESIVEKYENRIIQDDVDTIVNRELRAFVMADEERWGFVVVPILREDEQLMLGPDQFFHFETEDWMTNFFDGTK